MLKFGDTNHIQIYQELENPIYLNKWKNFLGVSDESKKPF